MIQIVMQQCAISVEKSINTPFTFTCGRTHTTSAPVAVTARTQYGYTLTRNIYTFINTLKKRTFISQKNTDKVFLIWLTRYFSTGIVMSGLT